MNTSRQRFATFHKCSPREPVASETFKLSVRIRNTNHSARISDLRVRSSSVVLLSNPKLDAEYQLLLSSLKDQSESSRILFCDQLITRFSQGLYFVIFHSLQIDKFRSDDSVDASRYHCNERYFFSFCWILKIEDCCISFALSTNLRVYYCQSYISKQSTEHFLIFRIWLFFSRRI